MLTDEEIIAVGKQYDGDKSNCEFWFARAVIAAYEAKLREQNLAQAAQIEFLKYAICDLIKNTGIDGWYADKAREALSIQPSQALEQFAAKLREQEPNQLTDGERIAAVGGVVKENLAVEFGSVMAVSAMLIKHENECMKLVNKYRDGLIAANEYAESLREEIARLEHPAPIPEGYALVPIEPEGQP